MPEQMGRPSTLNQEVQNKVVGAIQRGAYIETAAAFAGISKQSFYEWLKRGRRVLEEWNQAAEGQKPTISPHDANCANFADAIEKALAQSEMRDIQAIDDAAQAGNWQAAAWKLERKHHARWGRKMAITDNLGDNFFAAMTNAWANALSIEGEYEEGAPKKLNGGGDPLLEEP